MVAYIMAETGVETMLLGVSVMFVGGIMLFYASDGKRKGWGAILLVAGVCIGIGGYLARDMPNGSLVMEALGFLGIAAVILMLVLDNKKMLRRRRKLLRNKQKKLLKLPC